MAELVVSVSGIKTRFFSQQLPADKFKLGKFRSRVVWGWDIFPSRVSKMYTITRNNVGIADLVADAMSSLPLDGIEIDENIKKQVGENLEEFSSLPEVSRWGVIIITSVTCLYLTARPGVLAGAVDAYLLAPVQILIDAVLGRRGLKKENFILGEKLGEGSFGAVYAGAIVPRGIQVDEEFGRRARRMEEYQDYKRFQKVTLKKVKVGVKGAVECGDMEEWFNYRMARAAPETCAEFLGSFTADETRGQFTQGGKWLVWKYEGDSTLADFMQARDFPENLALFENLNERDLLKREGVILKKIMRQIITALKKMHSTGIVHRDVKPANIMVTNKGKIKFIDFGAATDLRIGKNYIPDTGILDPDYCPPELLVMPEETRQPPPQPIAAVLSPVLWQLNNPDLFDMYSAGIIMLQMSSKNLRSSIGLQSFKRELSNADYDLNKWRKMTRLKPNLDVLEVDDGGRGWDLVTKLVCDRKKRLSAAAALRHPYFLFGR